jgi:hypothetical protein
MTRPQPASRAPARHVPAQTAPESKSVSAAVWTYLESIPGLNEDLRAAETDLEAGRGVRYEVKGRALRRVQPEG